MMAVCGAMLLGSCGKKSVEPTLGPVSAPTRPLIGGVTAPTPKAHVYKMSGNYSANVPVNVDAAGNIVSFPAPTDLKGQEPVSLGNGYWLDRRGVGESSVFTRYTYAEYQELKAAPSLSELKAAIIPGTRVTEVIETPYTLQQASVNPQMVAEWIKNNVD